MLVAMATRPHLRIGSIPVHVEWPFFLIAALLGASGIRSWPGNAFVYIAVWVAIVFVSVLVHELGHAIAYRVFGQRPSITLTSFWGLTHGQRELPTGKSVIVSLSGALFAMVVLGIPAMAMRDQVYQSTHSIAWYQVVYYIGFVNFWWSLANLLPLLPLDGGNIAKSLFGLKNARITSIVTGAIVALWLFVIGYGYAGFFIAMLALMNLGEAMSEGFIGGGRGLSMSGGMGYNDRYDRDDDRHHSPRPSQAQRRNDKKKKKQARKRAADLGLQSVPEVPTERPPSLEGVRLDQAIWDALRSNDPARAQALEAQSGGRMLDTFLIAAIAAASGRAENAVDQFQRAFAASPTPPNLVVPKVIAAAGIAETLAARLLDDPTISVDATAELQNQLHYAGAFPAAARVGELLVADGRRNVAQSAFEVACSWSRAGDIEAGTMWLTRAVDAGFHAARVIASEDDLAPVRAQPGYKDVLARLDQI